MISYRPHAPRSETWDVCLHPYGIPGLSFDRTVLFPILPFCLILLLTLSSHCSANGPFSDFFSTNSPNFFSAATITTVAPLTLSLPQPVKFPIWKMHGRACKQCIFRSHNNLLLTLYVLMKIFSHACARNKTKRLEGFKFGTFIGRLL